VIKKISDQRVIYSKLNTKRVSWDIVAEVVFTNLKTGDENKDISIRNNFARLWRRFASEFSNENHTYEYNSIKHGLRAKMSGFSLAIGAEETPGVPAPPERMHLMGSSVFGSSFFVLERLHDRHNFTIKHQSLNWDPQNYIYALHLISMSINNVIGFLKILHGTPASEIQFLWAGNDEIYEEPWKRNSGISSVGWHSQITENVITPLSKEEILSAYDKNNENGSDTKIPT
jgi:hypothetical protein